MVELDDRPIDVARLLARVAHPEAGAEVLFVGATRQWTDGPEGRRETDHLVYEAYREMALREMERLEGEARRRWPLREVAIAHRLGRVDPTEASVAIAVTSPHRADAFEAARWLIDEIKREVPIWKQERFAQGDPEWIHPAASGESDE